MELTVGSKVSAVDKGKWHPPSMVERIEGERVFFARRDKYGTLRWNETLANCYKWLYLGLWKLKA